MLFLSRQEKLYRETIFAVPRRLLRTDIYLVSYVPSPVPYPPNPGPLDTLGFNYMRIY